MFKGHHKHTRSDLSPKCARSIVLTIRWRPHLFVYSRLTPWSHSSFCFFFPSSSSSLDANLICFSTQTMPLLCSNSFNVTSFLLNTLQWPQNSHCVYCQSPIIYWPEFMICFPPTLFSIVTLGYSLSFIHMTHSFIFDPYCWFLPVSETLFHASVFYFLQILLKCHFLIKGYFHHPV